MATSHSTNESPLVQQIQAYEDEVRRNRIRLRLSHCPKCRSPADRPAFFRRHDIRARQYWVVIDGMVQKIHSVITRWRCTECNQTFTLYPPFAMRHKRYVLSAILSRSQQYVDTPELSYRQSVVQDLPTAVATCLPPQRGRQAQAGHRPIFHASADAERITAESTEVEKENERDPALAHTTVYRWITTLGHLPETLRKAWELVKQKEPATRLIRHLAEFRVAPQKYRTEARRKVLQACRSLCVTNGVYAHLFDASIFPRIATGCAWA